MVYGYCRVSTKGQLDGNSIEEQKEKIIKEYPDANIVVESFSAAKERPLFCHLISQLNKDDKFVVTKLDRFCRTTKEGLQYIDGLLSKGIKIHIMNMGLIDNTPVGRLIVINLLAFAEFERAMIMERCQGGKLIAKQNPDFREGRPKKYGKKQLQHALHMLESSTYKEVEELTGISKSTLIRAKNRLEFL